MAPKASKISSQVDWVTAETNQDGVEAVLKPVLEIFEAPIRRPC
jgi:hypothetical protein